MTGWIIYSEEDLNKNRQFVEMFRSALGQYGVELKLVVLEHMPDKLETIPDFAINRSRNAEISYMLEKEEVRVFNSAKVTEIANDKAKTYDYVKDIVPCMPLIDRRDITYQQKKEVENSEGSFLPDQSTKYPYVLKSCSGHGGNQVFMINNCRDEAEAVERLGGKPFIRQECCSDLGKDVRVYIVGNRIVASVIRISKTDFRSNFSLGGEVRPYELSENERQMVNCILKKLPLDYGGIDFIFHHNKAVFNEIEDAVGARMLYATTDIDIVSLVAKYIVKCITHGQ